MLPKQYRLSLKTELSRIKKEGKVIWGKLFNLLVANQPQATNNQLPVSRFAFVISKKVHKRAVKRNRVRRLLVEAIRSNLGKIKPGFDFVFLVKKEIIGQELPVIKDQVEKIFRHEEFFS